MRRQESIWNQKANKRGGHGLTQERWDRSQNSEQRNRPGLSKNVKNLAEQGKRKPVKDSRGWKKKESPVNDSEHSTEGRLRRRDDIREDTGSESRPVPRRQPSAALR